MKTTSDVIIENEWTSFHPLLRNRQTNVGAAQSALLKAGGTIKKRLGLRTEPFRFRSNGSNLEVQASGVAGSISLNEISLQIVPKFVRDQHRLTQWDNSTLFLLEALAGKHVISLMAQRQTWKSHNVLDLMAHAFADAAERGLRDHPIHIYRPREMSSPVLRGRLNLARQLRNIVRAPHILECDTDQLDSENLFNDVLKWAASFLRDSCRDRDLRARLAGVADRIPGVANRATMHRHTRLIPPPQFQAWKDALELARLLANGMTFSTTGGARIGYSLLFNMERAFERFVEVAVSTMTDGAKASALTPSRQQSITYATPRSLGARELQCRPDNVIRRGSRTTLVVDAKYKLLDRQLEKGGKTTGRASPQSPDIYELLAGMIAHKCDAGLLVYPRDSSQSHHDTYSWRIDLYGKPVRIGAVSVDLVSLHSRAEMLAQISRVSSQILDFERESSAPNDQQVGEEILDA